MGNGVREDGLLTGIFTYSLAAGSYQELIGSERTLEFNASPTWLADGRHVAYAKQGGLFLLDSASRLARELLPIGTLTFRGNNRNFSFSKDSRTLVYASTTTEGDVWLMTLE